MVLRAVTLALATALSLVVAGCGDECDDGPLLERSCGGCAVPNCRTFEYATITSATVEPERVELGDPTTQVRFNVMLNQCGSNTPGPHEVRVTVLAQGMGGPGDAGGSERLFTILTLEDDGRTFGDETAMDGVIDVQAGNPFGNNLPSETEVVLRFTPFLNTCEGETFETTYRLGPRFMP